MSGAFATRGSLALESDNEQGQHTNQCDRTANDTEVEVGSGQGNKAFPSQDGLDKDDPSAADNGTES
jgi:hypothetical protein